MKVQGLIGDVKPARPFPREIVVSLRVALLSWACAVAKFPFLLSAEVSHGETFDPNSLHPTLSVKAGRYPVSFGPIFPPQERISGRKKTSPGLKWNQAPGRRLEHIIHQGFLWHLIESVH